MSTSTSPSKNHDGDRDFRKGAISSEDMAEIIRQLEEAKIRERQRAVKQNPSKQTLHVLVPSAPKTPKHASTKTEPKAAPHAPLVRNSESGPPPPAPTRSTFKFILE